MTDYREAIYILGSEAIVGISDLVVGEKDPRNLMVVFSILRVIIAEWDISGHAEVCKVARSTLDLMTDATHRCYSTQYFAISQLLFDLLQMILMELQHKT